MEEQIKKTTITKKDVSKRTARIAGEKIYLTEKIVDGVFQALREFMAEADPEVRIEIRDFGVFETRSRQARKAQNPKTLEPVQVPVRLTGEGVIGEENRIQAGGSRDRRLDIRDVAGSIGFDEPGRGTGL